MAEPSRPAWITQRLQRGMLLPLVRLTTPMADRLWSYAHPNAASALAGGYFDATVDFDADQYYNADGVYLEQAARLMALSGLEQSAKATDSAVLSSWSAAERAAADAELENGDGGLSELVGREFVLNQTAVAYLSFPGLMVLDALPKVQGTVMRWTLTKRSLRLEWEVR